jgi:hypothetical protein
MPDIDRPVSLPLAAGLRRSGATVALTLAAVSPNARA